MEPYNNTDIFIYVFIYIEIHTYLQITGEAAVTID